MKSFIITFIIAACSIALVTSSTSVGQCASGLGPAPISVTVNDCTNLPCIVPNQGSVNTTVVFTAVSDAKLLNSTIEYSGKGFSSGNILLDEVCSVLTSTTCPLKKGETVTGTFRGHLIQTPTTVTNLDSQVTIYDENNVVQYCFDVTFQITN